MGRSSLTVVTPLLLGLGAVAASGCGGGEQPRSSQPAAADRPAEPIRVLETEFRLEPANARIARSGRTTFEVVNRGESVHALAIETPSGEVKTAAIAPGESRTVKAELPPGRYTWYCPVGNHRERGMSGTIAVGDREGGSGAAQPEDEGTTGGGPGY